MADARFQFGPSQYSNILPDSHTKGKCCWDTLVKQSCDAFIAKAHCREWTDGSIHKHVGCFVVADVPAPPAVDDKDSGHHGGGGIVQEINCPNSRTVTTIFVCGTYAAL